MTTTSCLYDGEVMHHRLRPVRHRFVYRVFSLYLDLAEIPRLSAGLRLLRFERPGLLSFRSADHGERDGSPLEPWVRRQLAANGLGDVDGRIRLLCFPRLLGYVFNPLSIYFCHDRAGALRAIVYEVKNTFGDQHCYVFAVRPESGAMTHACAKEMYVSPFIAMDARYHFSLREPGERLAIAIRETVPEGPILLATQSGVRQPLTDRQLLRALAGNLLMTFKVIAGIHLEALRLWLKGAPYYPREKPAATGRPA
ncbi:MAG: DUF1365 domain-containing protein [Geminicoccaceae bacterium]